MKKILGLFTAAISLWAQAAEPQNYYITCQGKTGAALLKALEAVVGPHTNVGYDGLWEVYETSDRRDDGTLWDIYSTKPWPKNYTKCGNYSVVGDCINREHSFPKSWFGGKVNPMYADAYHLYPTDGKVNGQRSNFPYGECAGGSSLAAAGSVHPLGRLGISTFPGYSGKVFEPDDEYKGDLARSYFYMAAAYNSKIGGWSSEMLAGNSYPAFNTWAVNLLLKWSRQDPVSPKELNRNEAVSKHQKNRNPFIDHPELVEYIWGNKQGIAWYPGGAPEPVIHTPAENSVIDLGMSAVGIARTASVNVRGSEIAADVKVSVNGAGFSVSPATLPKDKVNAEGAPITVSYLSKAAGHAAGVLLLRTGDLTLSYTLLCETVDGLPVAEATDITDNSFTAAWTCIGNAADTYTLTLRTPGAAEPVRTIALRAGDEHATVSGLQPETAYTYTITDPSGLESRTVEVTTLAPTPSITLLYDGKLEFAALPGMPSDVAELLIATENIGCDITVGVNAPFQVSTDRTNWGATCTLTPDEDRFYMRLYAQTAGTYSTTVTFTADTYVYDEIDVDGTVSNAALDFHEDFEPTSESLGNYNTKTYQGSACAWSTNALFASSGDQAYPHEGNQAARTPKTGGFLTSLEAKPNGIGTVSLWARLWSAETTTATFTVATSDNDGATWTDAGTIAVPSTLVNGSNQYAEYSLPVNRTGNLRIRFTQTTGGRVMLDDIRLSSYTNTSGVEQANTAEYHSWDAYALPGTLVLEGTGRTPDTATIYAADGRLVAADLLISAGKTTLTLPGGLYLVTVRDFTRRVVVR